MIEEKRLRIVLHNKKLRSLAQFSETVNFQVWNPLTKEVSRSLRGRALQPKGKYIP